MRAPPGSPHPLLDLSDPPATRSWKAIRLLRYVTAMVTCQRARRCSMATPGCHRIRCPHCPCFFHPLLLLFRHLFQHPLLWTRTVEAMDFLELRPLPPRRYPEKRWRRSPSAAFFAHLESLPRQIDAPSRCRCSPQRYQYRSQLPRMEKQRHPPQTTRGSSGSRTSPSE